ncbi:B3 domain-containing protein REM8 [Eutrema salsugineum]|uniref:B3 domain-containing protein REM8 n=1 Tax=Eutrema salsugineum TaxID=72664 RepID=UPI000CECF543|nr:B3 domain-containing protein REM8 [Eutrema salsugineum]
MENASLFSPANPHFFQPLLTGSHSHLSIPVKFFSKHIEGKYEGKTVTLRSDASEKTWKVKMEGQRLTEGWKEFVRAHDLRIGDFVVFRHEGDMLFHVTALGPSCCEIQYAPSGSRDEDKEETSETDNIAEKALENRFVKLTPTPNSLDLGKQHLPVSFTRANGLIKPEKVILVDKNRAEWSMNLKVEKGSGTMYIMSGKHWKRFCAVNEVGAGESLTLELIRGGVSPLLKFCSKMEQSPFDAQARTHKRARVQRWISQETRPKHEIREKAAEEGEPFRRTRASNNANQGNLENTHPCSVSDLVPKVKQSVADTLTSIRLFREELEKMEQKLEDSLQEIDNLERRIQRQ